MTKYSKYTVVGGVAQW